MSWKSLITAGLLCVLASPAFAAPTLGLVAGGSQAGGHLDANGNWVWTAQITPDLALMPVGDTTGTPVAAELGFTSTNRNLLGVANATPAVFDTNNPATSIFPTWEVTYGSPLKPEGLEANFAGASASNVTNTASLGGHAVTAVNGATNQIIAAFGSANISTPGAKDFLTITVQRPVTTSASVDSLTTIQTSGAYGGNGRIAQINGGTNGGPYTTGNFDTFGGTSFSFTQRARAGDANLDGTISGGDFSALQQHFNLTPGANRWQDGDFNGDGNVTGGDFSLLQQNFGAAHNYTVGPTSPGAGSGLSSGSVPEPASFALMGLALLGGLGVIRRKH